VWAGLPTPAFSGAEGGVSALGGRPKAVAARRPRLPPREAGLARWGGGRRPLQPADPGSRCSELGGLEGGEYGWGSRPVLLGLTLRLTFDAVAGSAQ
jgi:hypothetical protein